MTLTPTPLDDRQYHALAHAVLATVEARADELLQRDGLDIDTSRTGGLLELTFPDRSKIVINTQPPLHEIWLAARSGGYHYKYVEGRWLDTRTGEDFFEVLSRCASEHAGRAVSFAPPSA